MPLHDPIFEPTKPRLRPMDVKRRSFVRLIANDLIVTHGREAAAERMRKVVKRSFGRQRLLTEDVLAAIVEQRREPA